MIQIDAKSIENMLVTSVIVFDNDIERLTKNLKKREIKETLSSFHSK
jgi:flagellar assembly factor FliW